MFLYSRHSADSLILRQYPGENLPQYHAQLRDKAETYLITYAFKFKI